MHFIDTIANAKLIAATFRADGKGLFVQELQPWFYFDAASGATGDDQTSSPRPLAPVDG